MILIGKIIRGFKLQIIIILSIFLLFISNPLKSQFYNGSQVTFGKSRVQYNDFLWFYFNNGKFNTYFCKNGKELAKFASISYEKISTEVEEYLDIQNNKHVDIIVFNSLSDLKQSNIGFINEQEYNIGGLTHIVDNKIFVYFDGDYLNFRRQLRAGYAQFIINQYISGESISRQIASSLSSWLPSWYIQGLVSFISQEWNADLDNNLKNGILSGDFKKINRLCQSDQYLVGHSMWRYISIKYGKQAIANMLAVVRSFKSYENSFTMVLGIKFKDFNKEWFQYYKNIYSSSFYTDNSKTISLKPEIIYKKENKTLNQVKLSSNGRYCAWVSNYDGLAKIQLLDYITKRKKNIFKQGNRLDEKIDLTHPIFAFHPDNQSIVIATELKGMVTLIFYDIKTKKSKKLLLHDYQKVLDIDISEDGRDILMSATQNGQSDIFIYNIATLSSRQITNDIFTDINPIFINKSQIVFASNRIDDTLRVFHSDSSIIDFNNNFNLFKYDIKPKNKKLNQLTNNLSNNIKPILRKNNIINFLSDKNGVFNLYELKYDSTIAYIDTTTHYKYTSLTKPLTNLCDNIINYSTPPNSDLFAIIQKRNLEYRIFIANADDFLNNNIENVDEAPYRITTVPYSNDSLVKTEYVNAKLKSKKHFYNMMQGEENEITKEVAIIITDTIAKKIIQKDNIIKHKKFRQLNYDVEYSINDLVSQLDFNYVNSSYQPFAGGYGPVFLTPGVNAFLKAALSDVMEDWRIVAGVRLDFDLSNNEYIASIANLKHRLDREIIFHRQSAEIRNYYSIVKYRIHELYYMLKYPFTQLFYIKGSAMLRQDRFVFKSTDYANLIQNDILKYWLSVKSEVVYDATKSIGTNLYSGIRGKLFGETYFQIDNKMKNANMFTIGGDIRYYLPIHRTFIWANRIATGTSFGKNKLIYYLGGVDTWLFPKFTYEAPIDYAQNYQFQTLATNLRGFAQNARNGNSFVLLNTEFRLPIFKYLANRTLKSSFLNDFQIVGYGDFGTAWTGTSPFANNNILFNRTINTGPLSITIEEQRQPFIGGIGIGARTMILGYWIRGDYAWGIEDGSITKPIFYFSLSLDF